MTLQFRLVFTTLFFATTLVSNAQAQVKFLAAAQIKPILSATKGQWVGVREYGGKDLLYFTHLLAWRCGLTSVSYAINGSNDFTPWDIGDCDEEAANPNAIAPDQPIYGSFPLRSVNHVSIQITYDDGSKDSAEYTREAVLIP